MCETKYDHPYIYLLEFHVGDGYFDRQSIGEYSLLVNYRDGSNILIKEKERGDERLVKFRQGKSIIFGINNPSDEMEILFQAIDNFEAIGRASIYFTGDGAPNLLAIKSTKSPTASAITTNLMLSHGAGSLQVYVRLTCFGVNLLTEFTVSGGINTEFDIFVKDSELSADESFARNNLESADGKKMKQILSEGIDLALCNSMSKMKVTDENDTSLTSGTSSINNDLQDENELLIHELERNKDFESIKATLFDLVDHAIIEVESKSTSNKDSRSIRNLDDLMFTNFMLPDESISQEEIITKSHSFFDRTSVSESKFTLSAELSLLDLKQYDSENIKENLEAVELHFEAKIGDVPSSMNVPEVEEDYDKSGVDAEIGEAKQDTLEVPCETGDAPTSSETDSVGDEQQVTSRLGQKRKKHFPRNGARKNEKNLEMVNEEGEQMENVISQEEVTKRKYAKGKRRGSYGK